MHFIGVDLAWGEQRPTGLAVLDDDGRLVHLSAHQGDADIDGALAAYTTGDCLVAIDAPLIVRNSTGNRPCEAQLNRDFARFDAGAHPANTSRPHIGPTPRGARLADRHGLDMDPTSPASRRAIEVYPHPATIVLFRLGRTLQYKNKRGRSFARLQSQLARLMGLIESLESADPGLDVRGSSAWQALVTAVGRATRKSELRVVEDQVDAVICAYVARIAALRPASVTTYGDAATGYIVTPTLPPGQEPGPRDEVDPADAAVAWYADRLPEFRAVTERYIALFTSLLDDAGINYLSVTGRTKTLASFTEKVHRTRGGLPLFPDPMRQITDHVGIRVITHVLDDVAAVADLLADELTVIEDRDMGRETASEGRFGYASRHLLVSAKAGDPAYATQDATHIPASVQVRTVLQHAWAEFEHEIRYKGSIPEDQAADLARRFTLAAGLLELADQEFSTIRARIRATAVGMGGDDDEDDPRIDAGDLAAFLTNRYTDAGWSREDHYGWMSAVLLDLGVTSLTELDGMLSSVDADAINARMAYRYPPGAVRRLDDALLAVFGSRYVQLPSNAHRTELLQARLDRVRARTSERPTP